MDAGGRTVCAAGRLVLASSVGAVGPNAGARPVPALSQPLGEMTAESVVSVSHLWRRDDVAHPLDGFRLPRALAAWGRGTWARCSARPSTPAAACPGTVSAAHADGRRAPSRAGRRGPDELRAWWPTRWGLSSDCRPSRCGPRWWPGPGCCRATICGSRNARTGSTRCWASCPGLSILGNHRRGISVNMLVAAARECARAHGVAG